MRISTRESPPTLDPALPTGQAADLGAASPGLPFVDVLRRIGRELDRGESEMNVAIRSAVGHSDLAPAQLIALQVRVYRYSSAIDLASRFVDHATSAIKTVLQANGQ